MKKSMTGFEKMFEENRERLELFCNVDANKDVNFEVFLNLKRIFKNF